MNEETIISEGGLTRREMLKKSALVGAVAWAAPVVSSFSTPAFAQVSPASCTDFQCGTPEFCGVSGPFGVCVCDVDTEGNSFCWENILCVNAPACSDSDDCATGWRCVSTCCSSIAQPTHCFPECGTNTLSTQSEGSLTGAG